MEAKCPGYEVDGNVLHSGLRWKSMNEESLSVGESHPDMIGLPGFSGL